MGPMRVLLGFGLALVLAGCGGPPPKGPQRAAVREEWMPTVWKALFDTSQGSFVVEVHSEWAPLGAQQFWRLVRMGFFDDTRIYRVRPGFIVQFGLSGDPKTNSLLGATPIPDDPPSQKNVRGTIAFAQSGPRSRRTQVFVNLKDNADLDREGFVPFGRVTLGSDVFDKLYSGYGEWEPPGRGPNANRALTQGNSYLDAQFPRLDKIVRARVTH